ncbi:MAG: LEA type 2 family protein [Gammaproteobacteria bacterium]|nr:LEA type 2 family protein [Gammaproteobacteria bacterium]
MSNLKVATVVLFGFISSLFLSGCSQPALKQILENQRPKVSIASTRISSLDFDNLTLNFGIKIDNPNPIPISLAGLDYDLKLAGKSFIKGQKDQPIQVAASGISEIELPITVGFKQLMNIFKEFKNKDSAAYDLDLGLLVDVPIIGQYRHPLKTSGNIPIPKTPSVKLANMSLGEMSFSGANVGVQLEIDNPNAFSLALDKLDYTLKVNGAQWFKGVQNNVGNIKANGKSVINLPLSLNFMDLGSGLFSVLSGGKALNYDIQGTLGATSDNALIGAFQLPINQQGAVNLSR